MPIPRVYKTEAVILRLRRLGESDRIVTLYTPTFGKLEAVAKGTFKHTSRLAGHLEPLLRSEIMLAQGRNLHVITQAQTMEAFPIFREDLNRLGYGVYFAELIERSTPPGQENIRLYQLLLQALRALSQEEALGSVARWFEMQASDALGYRPQLEFCPVCKKALQATTNFFSAAEGGVLCPGCGLSGRLVRPMSVNAIKVLRVMQRGAVEESLRIRINGDLALEIEGHLKDYLRHILEVELRSPAFIDQVNILKPHLLA